MALVDRQDLVALAQDNIPGDSADLAIRLAEADLRPLVRSRPWPTDRAECEDLWAATLRLALLYTDNPTERRVSTTGGTTDEWSGTTRADIRAEVAERYGGSAAPIGSFPRATGWPGL